MIGSQGPKMLRRTLPHVSMWNGWLAGNDSSPEAYVPLREQVDAACLELGRDPESLERTVSVSVDPTGQRDFPKHWYIQNDQSATRPLTGTPREIAANLRHFGEMGVSQIQIYPIPPTLATIEAIANIQGVLQRPA
jgi:alkanesulfonate monooxygenase SsuD/methylene tetrahydromethanopterin reductase-like flavin-dependent oxidoreductase (luciferase family)